MTAPLERTLYPVLYNACFGGFSVPEAVQKELAAGPLFSELFPQVDIGVLDGFEIVSLHEWSTGFQQIEGRMHGRLRSMLQSVITDGVHYYHIGSEAWRQNWKAWRSATEVVAACRRAGSVGVQMGGTRLEIKYVPVGCRFAVEDRDGNEQVRIIPPYVEVIEDLLGLLRGEARAPESLHPLTGRLLAGEILPAGMGTYES